MKKIINGRKYDTVTANRIDFFSNGLTGFDHYYEGLYQKRTSEFFLDVDDGYNGERIIPLSEKEAKKWLEEHSDGDTYEEVFGEVEE